MESPRKVRQLIGKVLLVGLLAVTVWAFCVQISAPTVSALAGKQDTTLHLAILTQPGMTFSFNPSSRKVILNTVKRKKLPKDVKENATDLLNKAGIQANPLRYYIPKTLKRDPYWEQFKYVLSSWHYNPILIGTFVWDYLTALHDKRTNVTPAEFLLFAMAATRLEITDFTVKNTNETKKKKKPSSKQAPKDYIPEPVADLAPLAVEDRPLLVEVLNASGVKGAALELTQYLRDKGQKGLLPVDVLNYENFPGGEQKEKSYIIDFTGRLTQVKQLSSAIGLNNEIIAEKQGNAICDVRIVIGKDFRQPI